MQSAPLVVREVIALVVRHQVDDGPIRQGRRLVENEPALLDTCSEWAHVGHCTGFVGARKRSRCPTKSIDLLKPGSDVVPTGRH